MSFEMKTPGKIRFRLASSEPVEEVDDDDDYDEDDQDDEEDSDERQRAHQAKMRRIQEMEAERYRQRRHRLSDPQVPLNPYIPPQPQYISVEAITNLVDSRFHELKGMLQMVLVSAVLSVIVNIVLATLVVMGK